MKRKFTLAVIAVSLALFTSISLQAQPDYSFKNAQLKSGTALSTGAVYKFLNVKPGVDANITVLGMQGGITLDAIDENWTGFDAAFQPFINVGTNSNGYVEFRVDFLVAGTETLMNQSKVAATCVDVDGTIYSDGVLYEQDQVQYLNGYYDFSMNGVNLQVLNPAGWITIRNTTGVSYPGIDTLQKDVMATVTNLNVSSLKFRIGARNTSRSKTEVRYRSIYFEQFKYPNSILLPNRTTLQFSGSWKNDFVELKGVLSASHTYNRMIIERGSISTALEPIGEISLVNTNAADFHFTFQDRTAAPGTNYYRLKFLNDAQQVFEYSAMILVKSAGTTDAMKLVNTLVNRANPAVTLYSNADTDGTIHLVDMQGRELYTGPIRLNTGTNSVSLSGLRAASGMIVIVVKTKSASLRQQAMLQ